MGPAAALELLMTCVLDPRVIGAACGTLAAATAPGAACSSARSAATSFKSRSFDASKRDSLGADALAPAQGDCTEAAPRRLSNSLRFCFSLMISSSRSGPVSAPSCGAPRACVRAPSRRSLFLADCSPRAASAACSRSRRSLARISTWSRLTSAFACCSRTPRTCSSRSLSNVSRCLATASSAARCAAASCSARSRALASARSRCVWA
mmetsp:Transcript_13400/g.39153  ORF Transcript_13400/g.39153 Transcript_13400/m.39153 type:complete len:208 (+) Transcript_13400:296-919(+)